MATTHTRLIKQNVAPQGASAIGVINSSGQVLGTIPLGTLAHTYGTKLFSFGLFSDVHMTNNTNYNKSGSYYKGEEKFKKALGFCSSYGVDFITICGDFSIGATYSDYQLYKNVRDYCRSQYNLEIYTCAGNHDMGMGYPESSQWTEPKDNYVYENTKYKAYTGNDINHYFTITKNNKKFHFIFLSCKIGRATTGADSKTALYVSYDITKWLTDLLNGDCKDGQRFIYVHAPLPERCNFGIGYDARSILLGDALEGIRNLSNSNPNNTIWFHGHTHWAWEMQGVDHKATYQEVTGNDPYEYVLKGAIKKDVYDNYDRYNKNANVCPTSNEGRTHGWHVHIPSNCIARYYPLNDDGNGDTRDRKRSQFAIVDVYSDHVIIKGLSFDNTDDESEIKYLPLAQYKLDYTATSGSGDSGSTDTGSGSTTRSYIDETNKIIFGFVGEKLDLGFTPEEYRRQDYSIFGASSTDTSVSNRITMSGSKMTFVDTANKNWSYGISGTVNGLSTSATETECWFWTYKSTSNNIKYKTIIAS